MARLSNDKRRKGCPTCGGVDPKTCMRCFGKTRMYDWIEQGAIHVYFPEHALKPTEEQKP